MVGAYAEGEQLPSESESRMINSLIKQLRESAPPSSGGLTKWLPTINVVLGVLLTLTLGGAFAAYKTGTNQLDANTNEISALRNEMKSLKEDRSARIAKLDEWRDTVEAELRVYRVGHSEYQQTKAVVSELGKKLGDGRDERLRDRENDRSANQAARDMIMNAIGDLKTQVALLRQSVEGARGRRPDESPFGDQNQRWDGPYLPLTPPYIQKATNSQPYRAVARRFARPRSKVPLLVSFWRQKPYYPKRWWP